MQLVPGIPDFVEYPVKLEIAPRRIPAGQPIELTFRVADPKTGAPVQDFQIVHEKYVHLFIVGSDLEYFSHEHPDRGKDGAFRHTTKLPKPGTYKMLLDFYPSGGTPQLVQKLITTAGFTKSLQESCVTPPADLAPKTSQNLEVELITDPPQPIAGKKTLLFFKLKPAEGLEPYLGAWAHMLIASNDLIDLMHEHPTFASGGPRMQFDIFFPREAVYRVWVQVQRKGVVNTVAFTIPVTSLK